MLSHRSRCVLLAGAAGALVTASAALAATQQTYSQKFTIAKPAQSSGMTFSASARDSSGGLPPAAKRVTLTFPSGTKINTSALAQCKVTYACPAKSKIGTGSATANGALKLAATAYNRAHGMVVSVSNPLGGQVVLTPVLAGNRLTITIPQLTLVGQKITITDLSLKISKIGTGKKAYIRTPGSCPKAKLWTFTARFDYADGTTTTRTSTSACRAR